MLAIWKAPSTTYFLVKGREGWSACHLIGNVQHCPKLLQCGNAMLELIQSCIYDHHIDICHAHSYCERKKGDFFFFFKNDYCG